MTRIYNEPAEFRQDAITGFSAAYSRYVQRVRGASGFIRQNGPRAGKVSVVVGGGSGHYPSYAGIVGAGLADGCVLGDIFTSPSAEQVYRIARAAASDSGVILSFGNYAGDRLNFAAAQERLIADGIDTRICYVTDDIASAPADEQNNRRGIAGTLTVYKVGGAAADAGMSLDEVERVMRRTNESTFSFGVAFAGCTFPGQQQPLFEVEETKMELGLGIHGEPGIETVDAMPAAKLAETLTKAVLAERPAHADGRAAVIVNGLGSTKYEELFVLFSGVQSHLVEAGVRLILPEVGEHVTSLDMAGCSLSVTWLDDELEQLWTAPADTAAFRRSTAIESNFDPFPSRAQETNEDGTSKEPATPASNEAAKVATAVINAMNQTVIEHEQLLGDIDAVAGDGDHGVGMVRGFKAATESINDLDQTGIGSTLRTAGDAFSDKAGGTSGILWGILLSTIGDELGDQKNVTPELLTQGIRRAADALQSVGKAKLGDKTMLDSLVPFIDTLETQIRQGASITQAWTEAAETATRAAEATANLTPRVGRARPLAERSIGTPDAGAVSMGLVLTAAAKTLNEREISCLHETGGTK